MIPRLALDTNALSAIADADPAIESHFKNARELCLPVIVLGEFRFGIAQSRRHEDYQRWLSRLVQGSIVLDITSDTADLYASIRRRMKEAGTPLAANDLWIAALCRQHSLPILTRDRDFDVVGGLERISW